MIFHTAITERVLVTVLLVSLSIGVQACAKRVDEESRVKTTSVDNGAANPEPELEPVPEPESTLGAEEVDPEDVANVKISPVLKRIKGRWVKEIPDPNRPNPPTMRLFAFADNTLKGRYLVAGGFADVGVEATLTEGPENNFTLVFRDDELRPHDWIPKERIFRGVFDSEKRELNMRTTDGEWIRWVMPETPKYEMTYSANIYRCVLIPRPMPKPTSTAIPSPGNGGGGTRPPSGGSGGGSGGSRPPSGGGSGGGSGGFNPFPRNLNLMVASVEDATTPASDPNPSVTPMATPSPGAQPQALNSCGVMSSSREKWSRMSGADLSGGSI